MFVNVAMCNVLSSVSAYWMAPFAPEIFNDPMVSKSFFTIFPMISIHLGTRGLLNLDDLLKSESRHDKNGDGSQAFRSMIAAVPALFMIPVNLVVFSHKWFWVRT